MTGGEGPTKEEVGAHSRADINVEGSTWGQICAPIGLIRVQGSDGDKTLPVWPKNSVCNPIVCPHRVENPGGREARHGVTIAETNPSISRR